MAAALRVRGRRLDELLGAAAGTHAAIEISDLVLDSRQVTPGAAFVALAGAREHGLDHVADARARGASVILYEPRSGAGAAVPEPSVAVPGLRRRLGELAQRFFPDVAAISLAGVTGTNGKSTVAWLIAEAMTAAAAAGAAPAATAGTAAGATTGAAADAPADFGGRPGGCGYIGTLGFGVPPHLTAHELTTPDCLTLHRELAAIGMPRVAMEVSSHALAQDRVAGLRFHTAVFTNLTRDHLDAHGDLERYGQAKARLFESPGLRTAVLNLNDAFSQQLLDVLPDGVTALGTRLEGDAYTVTGVQRVLSGTLLRAGLDGLRLDVQWQGERARIASRLIGAFNAENLLSALAALLASGVPLAAACRAIERCAPPPGRMEVLGGSGGAPSVVVDYAHTPDALERVLEVLRAATSGRLWCVFGCGGERDPGKRPLMGAAAARHADRIVLTDDNPRGEDGDAIIAAIRGGVSGHAGVSVQRERAAAIAAAVREAAAGDTVLVAGKGHERFQVSAAGKRAFSDRDAALAALAARAQP